jgi:DNA-binding Lrp family transcriptional regulator
MTTLYLLQSSKKTLEFEGRLDLTVAYVLAKVEAGKDQDVLKEVRKIPGVQSAIPTYGVYDLHVEASYNTMDELDRFIFDKIRRIPGIKETVTLIAFKGV